MASHNRVAPTIIAIVGLAMLVVLAPFLAKYRGEPEVVMAKIQKMAVSKDSSPVSNMRHRVWVNRRSGLFYCHGSKFYGKIWPGEHMRQGIALQKGFRPAEGHVCP